MSDRLLGSYSINILLRFCQSLLRGLDAVRGEWDLVCIILFAVCRAKSDKLLCIR